MEIDERKLKEILQEQQEQTERYLGALKEDFDHKLGAVLEYVKDIPEMKEKQDVMFDQLGQLTEVSTMIKEAVQDHEQRLQKIES